MATAFSTDSSHAMSETVEVAKQEDSRDVTVVFEINRCQNWIKANGYNRVALQFPDDLLCYSTTIVSQLRQTTSAMLFILGDTSYGSCCVDEVAAEHHGADALIHYGHSCLSQTGRLPVLFIFGQQPLDVLRCCSQVTALLPDTHTPLVLIYDVVYQHTIDYIHEELAKQFKTMICSELLLPNLSEGCTICSDNQQETNVSESQDSCKAACMCKNLSQSSGNAHGDTREETQTFERCGRKFSLPLNVKLEDCSMLYIGNNSLTLTNHRMTYNRCKFYSYNPEIQEAEEVLCNTNKLLMKRYFMVEKAKDAQIVGIIMGTLGIKDYLKTLDRMKQLCKIAGKKSYTFSMGKLNVAKLANFPEVDVYVLISCAENSLLDSSEFYRPIVTPYELELACNRQMQWTGEYETDFRQLIKSELPDSSPGDIEHDVSLVTGKIRTLGVEKQPPKPSTTLLSRDDAMKVAITDSPASGFLHSREWQGLQQKLGETEVSRAVEGHRGIAMSYTHSDATHNV